MFYVNSVQTKYCEASHNRVFSLNGTKFPDPETTVHSQKLLPPRDLSIRQEEGATGAEQRKCGAHKPVIDRKPKQNVRFCHVTSTNVRSFWFFFHNRAERNIDTASASAAASTVNEYVRAAALRAAGSHVFLDASPAPAAAATESWRQCGVYLFTTLVRGRLRAFVLSNRNSWLSWESKYRKTENAVKENTLALLAAGTPWHCWPQALGGFQSGVATPEPSLEGSRVGHACTQLYYICFTRVLDVRRWVIVGC